MSLIRLSCMRKTAFAPSQAGTLEKGDYNSQDGFGMLETFSNPTLKSSALGKDEYGLDADKMKLYLQKELKTKISNLKPDQPVVIMIHGFDYDPEEVAHTNMPDYNSNPHSRLYHFVKRHRQDEIDDHACSWPTRLGFSEDTDGKSGLAIAFAWLSLHEGKSCIARTIRKARYMAAYKYATESSSILIHLLHFLIAELKDHPIDIFAHSLGSRVVSAALGKVAEFASNPKVKNQNEYQKIMESISRVVILGGAEYLSEISKMSKSILNLYDNGFLSRDKGPSFYNFISRDDFVLNFLAESVGPRLIAGVIGHNGLSKQGEKIHGWMDLQLDNKKFQDWTWKEFIIEIEGDNPDSYKDHWYYYTWEDNNFLYRSIFRNRENWSHKFLRDSNNFQTKKRIPEGVN